jgi:hypothetical protein
MNLPSWEWPQESEVAQIATLPFAASLEHAHNCDVLLLGVGGTVAVLEDDRFFLTNMPANTVIFITTACAGTLDRGDTRVLPVEPNIAQEEGSRDLIIADVVELERAGISQSGRR